MGWRKVYSAKFWALALICSATLVAQQSVTSPIAGRSVPPSADECLRRSIPITIIQERGKAASPRSQDLQIAIDGKPASALSVAQEKLIPRVVLMVDTSASMRASPKESGLGVGLEAARWAAGAVPLNGLVAVATFRNSFQSAGFLDRATGIERVEATGGTQPQGKTALYNAVRKAASVFKTMQCGDSIYLVTDGGDNRSTLSLRQLQDQLISQGIRVFVSLVGLERPFKTPEEREGPDNMVKLAEVTGGALIPLPESKEYFTSAAAAQLATSIQNRVEAPLRLELQVSGLQSRPAKLKITIPSHPKGYTLAYPQRIEPCSDKNRE